VLSTPGMIAMMEQSAVLVVAPSLGEGRATVGFEVCVKHVGAAAEGSRCSATARLEEIVDGRKLRFAVEVTGDDGRTIGVGTHERRVIETKPIPQSREVAPPAAPRRAAQDSAAIRGPRIR
jgi:fluoroacetyl-CoA thioesterase